jgi:hypothetical protein
MNDETALHASADDHDAWSAHWATQGMPWRMEPETSVER